MQPAMAQQLPLATEARPVLIAGAGPVGLTAAAFLARARVPVRVVDASPGPTSESRALVLWRRSLQTLDPCVPVEAWSARGARPVRALHIADEGEQFATLPLDDAAAKRAHALPAGLLVSQADTEAALVQLLRERHGVTVERGTQLTGFSLTDDGGVLCSLAPSDAGAAGGDQQQQQQRQVEASYLLGCDGGRSSVRKLLGAAFEGTTQTNERRWLVADCAYEVVPGINPHGVPGRPVEEAEPPRDGLLLSTTDEGTIGVIPVPGREPSVLRIVWNAGANSLPAGTAPTLEDLQGLLMRHTRLQVRLTAQRWLSEFKVNERQVRRYVHCGGRVLLAGDAAHVHTPAGAQGLNTGVQDAANLAWKVALAATGQAASAAQLLETYQEERHPVGAAVIRNSGLILRANMMRSPLLRLVRRAVTSFLVALPPVRARIVATLAEDTVEFPSSSLAAGGGPCAGRAFPDVPLLQAGGGAVPATQLLRGRDGCFGTLVLLTPASAAAEAGAWPSRWGSWPLHVVRVARQGGGGGAADAVDASGALAAALGGADGVLVRPDGMVAAAGGPADVAAWLGKHVAAAAPA